MNDGRPAGAPPERLIASTEYDRDPEYSPDGQRIAFSSNRSGSNEVWVCNSDGSGAMQLTSLGSSFYTVGPHWSPDGRLIVFTSNPEGHDDTFVVSSEGGKPRLLFANSTVDSWSRDGRWIYFHRTGEDQVWRRPWPSSGQDGEAVEMAAKGGYFARESPDGKVLYYLKNDQELWKVPVKGREESQILDSKCCSDFAVAEQGIFFMSGWRPSGNPSIEYLSFTTGKTATIASLNGIAGSGFSVSPDGRWLLYTQRELPAGDLWMVENFR